MMEDLKSLEDLLDFQKEDSEIDRLLAKRQELPELEQYRDAHDESELIEASVRKHEDELRRLNLEFDRSDGELTIAEDKRDSEERRLYAGGLNARETSALMQEVEMLRRQTKELEDSAITLMESRDTQAQLAEEEQAKLEESQAVEERLEAAIKEQWAVIDADIARHEARKTEIAGLIDEDLMEVYDELREHKGVAVARLTEDMCGACRLLLSEAEQIQAARSDPPRCTHCRCILVL